MTEILILISGPVSSRSGYGDHCRSIVTSLINMNKFDVNILDINWGGCPRNVLKIDNPNHKLIIDRLVIGNQLPRQPDVYINLSVPNEFRRIGKFNIGISAGIETTLCSTNWIAGLNQMDLIVVPSNHAKSVFVNTGWTKRNNQGQPIEEIRNQKPIEVLFEGFDPNIFHKTNKIPEKLQTELNQIKESFNFLFIGHWIKGKLGQDRKDVGMLIKTFLETFKNQKIQPGLILKTSGAGFSILDREEILKKIDQIRSSVKADSLPNIYLLHGDLTDEEMNALYNHPKVKVHVSFSKGEGFCRPLLEASLSGKPIIASGWSGHLDFLDKDLSILLPGQLTHIDDSAVWKDVILKESKWFTVNYNYASSMLKDVMKNYHKYLLNAKKLAQINKTKFTEGKMTKKFEEILDKYMPEFPEQVSVSLPNLPKLKKIDNKINLPRLEKGDQKITLPKLKKIE